MFNNFKNIMDGLYFSKGRFIKYQLISRTFILIILLPLIKIIMLGIMHSKGLSSISNGMIMKYVFSLQGIMSILIMMLFGIFVVLVEIGGLVIISHQTYMRSKESSYMTIFKYTLTKYKDMMCIYGGLIVFSFVIIAPWLSTGVGTSLFSNLDIPGFVRDYIMNDKFYLIIYILLVGMCIVGGVLYIFTMHYIILVNQKPNIALRSSRILVTKNFKVFFKNMIEITFVLLLFIALIVLVGGVAAVIVSSFFIGTILEEYIFSMVLTIFVIFVLSMSFFVMPFEIYRLTSLFYKLNGDILELDLVSKDKHSIIDRIFEYRRTVVSVIILLLLISSFVTMLGLNEMDEKIYEVKVTSHRGSTYEAPENTISSIEIASRNGADYVEIDVQELSDGTLILMHDGNLKRTTGFDIEVWEADANIISTLECGSWFSKEFYGEKIPTLEDVILYSKGKIKLNIEVKTHGHEIDFENSLVNLIQKYNLYEDCIITSLDYEILNRIEKKDKKIITGVILYVIFGDISDMNVDFYSVEESCVNDKMVNRAHSLGKEVHVWTVNDSDKMEDMVNLGVDNIITDYDENLIELLKEIEENKFRGTNLGK